jgi:hypothetical protein
MDNLRNTPVLEDEGVLHGAWRAIASYRLALMLALTLLGLALLLTVEWPSYTLHLIAFHSALTVTISLAWPIIGLLTAVMAMGGAIIFHQHPAMRGEPVLALVALWPLPTLAVGLAALLLQRTTSGALWAGGIAVTGLLLYALFRLEYSLMDRPAGESPWAEWAIQVLAYLLALTYFVLIYRARLRTLLSAPAMIVMGGLLAMRLLHGVASGPSRTGWHRESTCALAIGLILGEATWALNYWPGRSIVGGILLLLIFYMFIGLTRQGLEGQLSRSALLEYGVVTLLGLGLLIRFG